MIPAGTTYERLEQMFKDQATALSGCVNENERLHQQLEESEATLDAVRGHLEAALNRIKCLEAAEALESVRGYVMSPEEIEAQRQSWAAGQVALSNAPDIPHTETVEGGAA